MTDFARRVFVFLVLLAAFAVVWYTARVFLLAFAGVLGALVLDAIAAWLAGKTGLSRGWSYAVVLLVIGGLLALAIWGLAPRVILQVTQAVQGIPKAIENLRDFLRQYDWGRALIQEAPSGLPLGSLVGTVSNLAYRVFEGVAGVIVIIVVAAYVGGDPRLYSKGLIALVPADRRQRARQVLGEVAYTLRWWVLGQLVPMIFLGLATMIGLELLGIPLAFTLGLFTGIMIFIPYIGSFIAFLVTIIVTVSTDLSKVLAVTILFIGIHTAEGYVLTPMVQRRAVHLPPALTILAQVLMGLLLGFLGLALATPLTAAALVLVEMLYLGQQPEHH